MAQSGGRKKAICIPSTAEIEDEIAYCIKHNISILCVFDSCYPQELTTISDPPPLIMMRGNISLLSNTKKIAIVGARNASVNGLKMAEQLSRALSQRGYVIVSGIAKGIDAAAHMHAVETKTIGVIASGIDNIYPRENKSIFERLYENGIVMTEYKVGIGAAPQHFPQRNRIISGLSVGVVVIEAAKRSGTLITARLAAEQGREVFAVPGSPFDIRCSGTNSLIKSGAILVQNADDIISELEMSGQGAISFKEDGRIFQNNPITHPTIPSDKDLSTHRKRILELIPYNPIKIEDIINYLSIDMLVVNLIILELELAGKIIRTYGNSVMRLHDTGDN